MKISVRVSPETVTVKGYINESLVGLDKKKLQRNYAKGLTVRFGNEYYKELK